MRLYMKDFYVLYIHTTITCDFSRDTSAPEFIYLPIYSVRTAGRRGFGSGRMKNCI